MSDSISNEQTLSSSHHPGRMLSHTRMRVQQLIKKIPAPLHVATVDTTGVPPPHGASLKSPASGTLDKDIENSDDTIIYQPPPNSDWSESDTQPLSKKVRKASTLDKPPRKLKVKFFGLSKKHGVQHKYKGPKCALGCSSVSSLNIHYCTSHPPVTCSRCGK